MAFVRSGMAGKDVAEMLGVSSAAVVYNWARAAEDPSPVAADRSPIEPMRDSVPFGSGILSVTWPDVVVMPRS